MKRIALMLFAAGLFAIAFTSCRNTEIEQDPIEETGQQADDGTQDVEYEVDKKF